MTSDLTRHLAEAGGVPQSFTRSLTSVLAGHELPEAELNRLSQALTTAFDAALFCRHNRLDLNDSSGFRAASGKAYRVLLALGVSPQDSQNVVVSLLKAGAMIANRGHLVLVRPAPLTVEDRSTERL